MSLQKNLINLFVQRSPHLPGYVTLCATVRYKIVDLYNYIINYLNDKNTKCRNCAA